ncbi:MAG: sigma-54-dependent Fis family transcriptional regulator, partial [Acidobacteriaceae bacterium]|nr:sigma-54-dependent Fis family transcriptional regulator [Acidobacteriaceae bacterium]
PLRERKEDIVPIALDLVRWFNQELKKNFLGFTPEAAELLVAYPWPGNIRELKNVVERTMILAPDGNIDAASLPEEIREPVRVNLSLPLPVRPNGSSGDSLVSLKELEDEYIQKVLAATANNKTQAAKILGIHPTSLMRKLKKETVLS